MMRHMRSALAPLLAAAAIPDPQRQRVDACVQRHARHAAPGRRARAAAPPVHGAQRALQPARRRLPDRHLPAASGRSGHGITTTSTLFAADCGSVTFDSPGPDRHRLRRDRRADAADARPQDARHARRAAAAAARPAHAGEPLHELRRRRLLLPRQPGPGGRADDHAPRPGVRRDAGARASRWCATSTCRA